MNDPPNPKFLSYLNKHRPIVDIGYLFRAHLRNVQCNPVHICIRLAVVDKTRRHKKVNEGAQFELSDAIDRKLPSFITNRRDLKSVLSLEIAYQLDHLRKRLGLGIHKSLELFPREGSLFIKNNPVQIFV